MSQVVVYRQYWMVAPLPELSKSHLVQEKELKFTIVGL
jgi:hypothetical protein